MSARRKRRHEEEEHENVERWLVTYADMLTVLMALFIVMYAMSVVDQTKFEKLAAGFQDYFGSGPSLLDGGNGLLPDQAPGSEPPTVDDEVEAAVAALQGQRQRAVALEQERHQLEQARKKIASSLTERGLAKQVRMVIDERGLVVTLVTDEVLFDLGSASLRSGGRQVLDAVAPAVAPLPNPVTVEGHTDNLPISGGRFPSNWELSAERATSVLRYLVEAHRLPPKRMSAAGYADQRPLVENTPAGRPTNRRVEVIIRSVAGTEPASVTPAANTPAQPVPAAPHAAAPNQEKH